MPRSAKAEKAAPSPGATTAVSSWVLCSHVSAQRAISGSVFSGRGVSPSFWEKKSWRKNGHRERYIKKTGSKAGVDVSAQLESFKCDNLERGLKSKLSSELINFVGEVCVSRG